MQKHLIPARRGAAFAAVWILLGILTGCAPLVHESVPTHDIATVYTEPDRVKPTIQGVRDLTVYQGDAVAYRSGVTVLDDRDPNPSLRVDCSGVNLSTPGRYEISYIATDAAGNSETCTAAVTVLEHQPGYADIKTIYDAVDAKLAAIVEEGMTAREQVQAIYSWARGELGYAEHADQNDWLQAGYRMLTEGRGDCYGYFAVTKLMFTRLDIPNMDVRKVKNFDGDSDHYWSLVSVDGGKSYYHFDATPRVGSGDNFCLVTDRFLDAYSAEHKLSHNRDRTLYPATPEE